MISEQGRAGERVRRRVQSATKAEENGSARQRKKSGMRLREFGAGRRRDGGVRLGVRRSEGGTGLRLSRMAYWHDPPSEMSATTLFSRVVSEVFRKSQTHYKSTRDLHKQWEEATTRSRRSSPTWTIQGSFGAGTCRVRDGGDDWTRKGRVPNNASAGRRETPPGDQSCGEARRIAETSPGNTPRVHPALVAAVVWTAR